MGEYSGAGESMALDRVRGALYGMLIADATAMPTHWYYGGLRQVKSDYGGPIDGYKAPPLHQSDSIMGKSNTAGGGRGSDQGSIIGDVINHGKRKFWASGTTYHYHQGMAAGDNTLEGVLTRNVIRVVGEAGKFNPDAIISDYVSFMTTPGSHNDTYASTAHRMFFANHVKGMPIDKCPDNDRHNVDTTDAITMAIPICLLAPDDETAATQAAATVALTRDSPVAQELAKTFCRLLRRVILGTDLREAVTELSTEINFDVARAVERAREDPLTA